MRLTLARCLPVAAAVLAACTTSLAEPMAAPSTPAAPSVAASPGPALTPPSFASPYAAPAPPQRASEPAPAPAAAPATPIAPPLPPAPRVVTDTGYAPFATAGGVTVVHPSARVELIGFHESNLDGARQMEVLASAAAPVTMETRNRDTASRGAADIVSDPDLEIRAPVTGTVVRAGTYVLYCEYSDDFAVIEPDAHPGWEVKILHIDGVRVHAGDRVEAGVTVVAGRPTRLPFASQVDEHSAAPSWPHVHVEIVDPSIPDRPSPGGGC